MASAVAQLCQLKLLHKFQITEEAGEGTKQGSCQGVPASLRTENRDSFNISGWNSKCTGLCFRLKRMLTARVGAMVSLLLAPKQAKIEFVGWNFPFSCLVLSRIRIKPDTYS